MMKRLLQMASLCLLVAGRDVSAQSTQQTLFIDGTFFGNLEWRSPDANPLATVVGGGVAAGAWLNPRVTVRFELSLQADHVARGETVETTPTTTYVDRSELLRHERTAAVLMAYHTARHKHVQLAYVGGVAFLFLTQQRTDSITVSPPSTTYMRSETETWYGPAVVTGLDGDVALGQRLSMVPHLRLTAAGGLVSVRPAVALRVHW
jgi:hypothetical protein